MGDKPELKLYVVGADSPNPEKWSRFSEPALVIAESPEQACTIADDSPATEIKFTKPVLLMRLPEPNLGPDL